MSPNRLSVTITSNRPGSSTRYRQAASTWAYSSGTPGLGRHLAGDPAPQVPGVRQHVGLVHQGQPPAPPGGQLGGVPHAALHPGPGVQRLLGRALERRCRGARCRPRPRTGPRCSRARSRSRGRSGWCRATAPATPGRSLDGRRFTYRSSSARSRSSSPRSSTPGRHVRAADGAEQDRVGLAQLVERRRRAAPRRWPGSAGRRAGNRATQRRTRAVRRPRRRSPARRR